MGRRGASLADPEIGDRGCKVSACAASSSEVAETCSEADAFCCVTLSSCWIAWLIWPDPTSCSRQAAEISSTNAAVFLMSGTSRPSMSPACCAALTVSIDSVPISPPRRLAALGELPHLARHHGKAPSVLAGSRRLDGGVQPAGRSGGRFPARW